MPRQLSCAAQPRTTRSLGRPHRPSAIVRTLAQATAPRIFRYKDSGAWTSEFQESCWHGFTGQWLGNVHDPAATTSHQGLRTFRWQDSSRCRLDQINVYSGGRPGVAPRGSDGLIQIDLHYDDKMVDPGAREEPVSLDRACVVAASPAAFAWVSRLWLPPVALPSALPPPAEVLAAARAAAEDDSKSVQPVRSVSWGMEIFLRDGDCRWSFPLVYDAGTGLLTRASFIREYATGADPTTPHVLTALGDTVREPRPALPEDPGSWPSLLTHGPALVTHGSAAPTHGSVVGRRVARLWAAPGGGHLLLDDALEDPVQWDGPPGAPGAAAGGAGEQLLLRLPDAMYIRVPKSIAAPEAQTAAKAETALTALTANMGCAVEDTMSSRSSCSVMRFEVGGLLRSPSAGGAGGGAVLARVVVQYDRVTGSFIDLSHEVFSASSAAPQQ